MIEVRIAGQKREFPKGTSVEVIKNALAVDFPNIMDYEVAEKREGDKTVIEFKERTVKKMGVNG